ncbi:hypothetical protein DMH15_16045 [Streptomyces sp. WAC 06725]|uniref:hypothetical protein n=1 Tax=Streptomyces sp. WAC 06725 TaxID=2203209 RepID=UPI000F74875E|nr:hypothetical protein [Streptomyces sp. WAC 06725]RSO40132.1 hypothetical protein DMH15_16045 [Streptomyces sp. WAC 06725]
MNTVAMTVAGAVLSVVIFILNVRSWWKGNRELKALMPFGGGLITGAGWTMCVGGIFGWVATQAVEASNKIGDKAVSTTTGAKGGGGLAHGSLGSLTYPGACAVLVAALIGAVVLKAAGKADTKRMLGGLFTGLTLCATAGFAQGMQWVPDLYNWLGNSAVSIFDGKVSL